MKYKRFFVETLVSWNGSENKREMPWKGEKDPYKIWISEIILQQTRVQQGLGYYFKFIQSFPDVKTLAEADEQEVFKHWEGLGYYSRCRNLIASAKFINTTLQGKFPEKYEDILALKGIGSYTASAIASFAFNQPYAVLDGNVFRVLSRFFGIDAPVDSAEGKKTYSAIAGELLDRKNPGIYNQAIMDFGAIVCKPAQPACETCPMNIKCIAFNKNLIKILPVKEKSIKRRERFFTYLIVDYCNAFYIKRRTGKDIWQGLHEFILIETKRLMTTKRLIRSENFLEIFGGNDFTITAVSKTLSQKLTHQTITGNFCHIHIEKPLRKDEGFSLVSKKQLKMLPFPKFITSYLED